jgi:RND family efflux transporter MFP subunit
MSPDKQTLDALRINRVEAPRARISPVMVVIVLAILALGGGVTWWASRPDPIVIKTAVAQESSSGGGDRTLLNASGYVTARREATVSSKVTGKVVEVPIEEGMRVEAGQLIAKLDASNIEKSLHLAEAQLESARRAVGETQANLTFADHEVERITKMVQQNAESQTTLDRAITEAKALRARLEKQQAEIEVSTREVAVWNQQIEDMIIRAPFAGIVTTKNAQPGEMISPMSVGGFTRTGICTIVDMNSLEIEVDVSESFINRVQSAQPVQATLDSYPNWQIPGKVIAIIPTADRQKATVKVRVGFDKLDPRILPDMSVKVAFLSAGEVTKGQRIVTIPKAALRSSDGKDIVWIARDGKVERRAVNVDMTVGDTVTLSAGVSGGERVIVEGHDKLRDGASVTEKNQ